MARKNLYINNTNIGTYGIYISSDTILNSPQIDYKEYSVPGRTGNIIQYNNRLDNVVRKFTCHIPLKTNVASGLASLHTFVVTIQLAINVISSSIGNEVVSLVPVPFAPVYQPSRV